jgi:hypothetical protein
MDRWPQTTAIMNLSFEIVMPINLLNLWPDISLQKGTCTKCTSIYIPCIFFTFPMCVEFLSGILIKLVIAGILDVYHE